MHLFTKSIQLVFYTLGLVASICTISYCIYKYNLDEDSTSVDFKSFDKYNAVQGYPSFTLCFLAPFLENRLELQGEGIDVSSYINAAFGGAWDPRINKVDYDTVTINLNENIIFTQEWNDRFYPIVYQTKTDDSSSVEAQRLPFYVSHRCPWGKCFSQDLPYGNTTGISKHDIWINMDVFPNKTFPPGRDEVEIWTSYPLNAFGIIFHSPNQLTRSIRLQSSLWDLKTKNASAYKYHVLKFTVKSIQVLRRRNKGSTPCVEGRTNDDEDFYQSVMNQVGCRPPFMKSSLNLPNCSSKEQLQSYNSKIGYRMEQGALDDSHTTQPCISLESLDYTLDYNGYSVEEIKEHYSCDKDLADLLTNASSAFKLEFNFRLKRLQLMTKDQKYCLETLIGNAGTIK